jgi:hypothetical protein
MLVVQGAEMVKTNLNVEILVNLNSPPKDEDPLSQVRKFPHVANALQQARLLGGLDGLHLSSSSFPAGAHLGWRSRFKVSQLSKYFESDNTVYS